MLRRAHWMLLLGLCLAGFSGGDDVTMRRLGDYPGDRFQPYLSGPLKGEGTTLAPQTIAAFRDLLDLYEQRQKDDDNFTIHVVNFRTGEDLESFVLQNDRDVYQRDGAVDWKAVDVVRREETHRLVKKYEGRGVPKKDIVAKWGRANQVLEARRNERAYLIYEVRLAQYLGLSLLSTEIGTVETFNQDDMVSAAGARSRYQMMPDVLQRNGLHRYRLRTKSGAHVYVDESLHPLLTMEPAFITLRGYVNAVGHELPGLSAYHAGPGNIFRIYRLFAEHGGRAFNARSTVADAYVWGVTDGYERVSRGSSFGAQSRGYVAAAYGSMRATEDLPIDTLLTLRAERVQLRPGRTLSLGDLLDALQPSALFEQVAGMADTLSAYERFRQMNPHFSLPIGEVLSEAGDVILRAQVGSAPVRFFVPRGTSDALRRAGIDVLDDDAMFRFDERTYLPPPIDEVTRWDRAYAALVRNVASFGFDRQTRKRVFALKEQFERLAEEHPTAYRRRQLHIISIHARLWDSPQWLAVSDAIAKGKARW